MPKRSGLATIPVLLLSLGAMAQPQTVPGSIFANGARTYYEAIDLSTPEAAAGTFLSAWARRDYATASVALSPAAQRGWSAQISQTLSMQSLFPGDTGNAVIRDSVWGRKDRSGFDEVARDPNLLFDDMLQAGERRGVLPFTLGPGMKTDQPAVAGDQATVAVETDGRPAKMTLALLRLPSGRWKVDQILLPGADPALKPWGFNAP